MLSSQHFNPSDPDDDIYQPPIHLHRPPLGHGPKRAPIRFVKAKGRYDEYGGWLGMPDDGKEEELDRGKGDGGDQQRAGVKFWKELDLVSLALKPDEMRSNMTGSSESPCASNQANKRNRQRSPTTLVPTPSSNHTHFVPTTSLPSLPLPAVRPPIQLPKSQWFIRRALLAKQFPSGSGSGDFGLAGALQRVPGATIDTPEQKSTIKPSTLATLIDLPPPPPLSLALSTASSLSTSIQTTQPLPQTQSFIPPPHFHLDHHNVGYRLLVRSGWDERGGLGRGVGWVDRGGVEGGAAMVGGKLEDGDGNESGDERMGEDGNDVQKGASGVEGVQHPRRKKIRPAPDLADLEIMSSSIKIESSSDPSTSLAIPNPPHHPQNLRNTVHQDRSNEDEDDEDDEIECTGGYDPRSRTAIDLTIDSDPESEEEMFPGPSVRSGGRSTLASPKMDDDFRTGFLTEHAIDEMMDNVQSGTSTRLDSAPGQGSGSGSGSIPVLDPGPGPSPGPGRTAPIATKLKLDLGGIGHHPKHRHSAGVSRHSQSCSAPLNGKSRITHTINDIRFAQRAASSNDKEGISGPMGKKMLKRMKEREREEMNRLRGEIDF